MASQTRTAFQDRANLLDTHTEREIERDRERELTAQNKKRITVANPPTPLTTVDQKIPLAAVILAFLVSSATWPDASKPMSTPAVARYDRHQFQPDGAPVPLYVVMKASWADRKPQVLAVPMGSQMIFSRKSSRTTMDEK